MTSQCLNEMRGCRCTGVCNESVQWMYRVTAALKCVIQADRQTHSLQDDDQDFGIRSNPSENMVTFAEKPQKW